jgi:hypothetical protein
LFLGRRANGKAKDKIPASLKLYINKIRKDQQKLNVKAVGCENDKGSILNGAVSLLKSASHLDISATLCSINPKCAAEVIFAE